MTLRLMSFNLRINSKSDGPQNALEKRIPRIFSVINKYSPDILAVQELTPPLQKKLESRFASYTCIFRQRGKIDKEGCGIFIKNTAAEILYYNTFWLSRRPEKPGSRICFSIIPRICIFCELKLKGGCKLRVFNTHLDAGSSRIRAKQTKALLSYINERGKNECMPDILCGDFNCGPNSSVITDIGTIYHNTMLNFDKTTFNGFKNIKNGRPIDFIFLGGQLKKCTAEIIYDSFDGFSPSDHYPIMVDLEI